MPTVQLARMRGLEICGGLFFEVACVFSAPVDAFSGMTVNLKDVDVWLNELWPRVQSQPAFHDEEAAAEFLMAELKKKVGSVASVVRLEFRRSGDALILSSTGKFSSRSFRRSRNRLGVHEFSETFEIEFPSGQLAMAKKLILQDSSAQQEALPLGFRISEKSRRFLSEAETSILKI